MLADGGECVSDLAAVRDHQALFGPVASDSTALRVIDRVASEPGLVDGLRVAHAWARERFWRHGAPGRLTIDIDATLITAHSEKEKAAGNYKLDFRDLRRPPMLTVTEGSAVSGWWSLGLCPRFVTDEFRDVARRACRRS